VCFPLTRNTVVWYTDSTFWGNILPLILCFKWVWTSLNVIWSSISASAWRDWKKRKETCESWEPNCGPWLESVPPQHKAAVLPFTAVLPFPRCKLKFYGLWHALYMTSPVTSPVTPTIWAVDWKFACSAEGTGLVFADTKAFFVINQRFPSIIITPNGINHGYVFNCSAGNKKFKLF
jgi:hypothetical protein